jgi:hypothetical protein
MDDWRRSYRQTGKPYIEPLEYLPAPGSVACRLAVKKSCDDDEEVDDDLYPVEMCE